MISVNAVWIFTSVAFLAVSLILLTLILLNSTLRHSEFSLLRHFPYEFLKMNDPVVPVFKPLMFVLTGLAFSPLFVITPLIAEFGDLGFLSIFITCVFGLAAISNCFLFLFDARYTKTHLVLVTIAMALTLLANALAALLSIIVYKTYLDMATSHVGSLVLGIVSGVIALGVLFMIVNPKLTSWAKLKSQESDSGEKTYSRGKVFVLAFSEWINIALAIIGELIFLLALLK